MVAAQLHLIHGGRRAFDVDGDNAGPPRRGTDDTAPCCRQHDPKHQDSDRDAPTGSHARSLGSGSTVREHGYGDDVLQMDTF